MALSEDIQEAAQEALERGLAETEVRGRKLKFLTGTELLNSVKAEAMLRGFASARRGLSVGRIERPTS